MNINVVSFNCMERNLYFFTGGKLGMESELVHKKRCEHTINVLKMIQYVDVYCLQECSDVLVDTLTREFSEKYEIFRHVIFNMRGDINHSMVTMVSKDYSNIFNFNTQKAYSLGYPARFQVVTFENDHGFKFAAVNIHGPGCPDSEIKRRYFDFITGFVEKNVSDNARIFIVGDFNAKFEELMAVTNFNERIETYVHKHRPDFGHTAYHLMVEFKSPTDAPPGATYNSDTDSYWVRNMEYLKTVDHIALNKHWALKDEFNFYKVAPNGLLLNGGFFYDDYIYADWGKNYDISKGGWPSDHSIQVYKLVW